MKKLILLSIFLTKVVTAWGAIPSLDFILSKSTATTGRQVIQIEQDVIFKLDNQELIVAETWLIEGDKNLKLSAKGKNLIVSNLQLNYFYNNKTKSFLVEKTKMTAPLDHDFYQKLLFVRSINSFKNHLSEMNISENVRLSRADGRIAFAIGDSSSAESAKPQFWIDQDEFLLRKIRLPSLAIIELSDYKSVKNDFIFSRTQKISWLGQQVEIKVKSVSVKPEIPLATFSPQNLNQNSNMISVLRFDEKTALTDLVTQFYQRFR